MFFAVRCILTKAAFDSSYLVLQAHGDEVEELAHARFVQAHDGRMCKLSPTIPVQSQQ